MEFYKIKNPKLSEFVEAIDKMEYFTMEQFSKKKNQLKVYFSNEWGGEILLSFVNVTNAGGFPILFSTTASEYEVLSEFYGGEWYELTEEEKEHEVELFGCYIEII
jgi:hypothetical protein